MIKYINLSIIIIGLLIFTNCKKTTAQQMKKYIEFYYPTSGEATYEIIFDWGIYFIVTAPGKEEKLSNSSEPYRGFITMRPYPNNEDDYKTLPVYLITGDGYVWIYESANEIPLSKEREEVLVERGSDGATTTTTTTINSPLEAVVDHFNLNPAGWKSYGVLKPRGNSYFLDRTKE